MSKLTLTQIRAEINKLEAQRREVSLAQEIAQRDLDTLGRVVVSFEGGDPVQDNRRATQVRQAGQEIAVRNAQLQLIDENLGKLRRAEVSGTDIDSTDPESSLVSSEIPIAEVRFQDTATVQIRSGELAAGSVEDFSFSPTQLQRNNPEAFEKYITVRNAQLAENIEASRQDAELIRAGQTLDPTRSVTNTPLADAERVALTAVRAQAEAAGALTVTSTVPSNIEDTLTPLAEPAVQGPISSVRPGTLAELQQELAAQQARIPPLVEQLNTSLSRSEKLQQQIQQRQDIIAGLDANGQAPPGLTALAGSGTVAVQRARAVAALQTLENQLAAEAVVQSRIESELQQVGLDIQDIQRTIDGFSQTFEDDLQLTPATPVTDQQSQAAAIVAASRDAQAQAQIAVQRGQAAQGDWRVKLRLAGDADYLYRAEEPGILAPLADSDGVIFPYMPNITTSYNANYSNTDLTHSNYRGYFYQSSYVGEIQIAATFTAQDTDEANYLLAVIHFFRSVTKMFYGQDTAEYRGAPPPLVFLQGLGEFQFNLAPCVVQNFNYVLPQDVDYVRARVANVDGTNLLVRRNQVRDTNGAAYQIPRDRLLAAGIPVGGIAQRPAPPTLGTQSPTYVPTKMEISLTLLPVQTRAQISREFSLENYANGSLIQRGFW